MEEMRDLHTRWQHWRYHNTALLVISLVAFFFLADTSYVRESIARIGNLGYVGALLAGMLFVSIFTVAPASVILYQLADKLNPLGIAAAAGIGAMVGDYLIFRYLRDGVFEELGPLFANRGGVWIHKLFLTPYFAWAIPIIGAFIVMSPVPDEIGIGLMGLSKIKTWQLLALLYLLNAVGIFLIVIAARSF